MNSLRLITGHGFEALARGVRIGILPPQTPRWRCSRSGTNSASSARCSRRPASGSASARIGEAPPRLAPYLAAALACNLTLAACSENLGDLTWFTALGIAVIAADVAARSQYRTTRPSAETLAHF